MAKESETFTLPVCMVDDGGGQFHFEAASRADIENMGPPVVAEYHVELDPDLREAFDAFVAVDALLPRGLIEHLLSQMFAAGFQMGQANALGRADTEA